MNESFVLSPEAVAALLRVKEEVLAEPTRVNMAEGVMDLEYAKGQSGHSQQIRSCGTVGCIAGWLYMDSVRSEELKRGLEHKEGKPGKWIPWDIVNSAAHKLLGLYDPAETYKWESNAIAKSLFYPNDGWPQDLQAKLRPLTPGTPEYAAVVAERIDQFIAQYAA